MIQFAITLILHGNELPALHTTLTGLFFSQWLTESGGLLSVLGEENAKSKTSAEPFPWLPSKPQQLRRVMSSVWCHCPFIQLYSDFVFSHRHLSLLRLQLRVPHVDTTPEAFSLEDEKDPAPRKGVPLGRVTFPGSLCVSPVPREVTELCSTEIRVKRCHLRVTAARGQLWLCLVESARPGLCLLGGREALLAQLQPLVPCDKKWCHHLAAEPRAVPFSLQVLPHFPSRVSNSISIPFFRPNPIPCFLQKPDISWNKRADLD